MESLFVLVLNMSITASLVILAVILIRLLTGRLLPKKILYFLWMLVLIRLLLPISIGTPFSIFNALDRSHDRSELYLEYVSENIGFQADPEVHMGIPAVDQAISDSLPDGRPEASVNPIQVYTFILCRVWILGVAAFILLNGISYVRFGRKLKTAILWKSPLTKKSPSSCYFSDRVASPLVYGFWKPRIYLPKYLVEQGSEEELTYILRHETVHIRRWDHLIKPLWLLALSVHWMNPLVWAAFFLSDRDRELSCDEKVMEENGGDIRKSYAESLLQMAAKQNGFLAGSFLSFGESHLKQRIKNILSFRKPFRWAVLLGSIVVFTAALLLLTNPMKKTPLFLEKGEAVKIQWTEGESNDLRSVYFTSEELQKILRMEDWKKLSEEDLLEPGGPFPTENFFLTYQVSQNGVTQFSMLEEKESYEGTFFLVENHGSDDGIYEASKTVAEALHSAVELKLPKEDEADTPVSFAASRVRLYAGGKSVLLVNHGSFTEDLLKVLDCALDNPVDVFKTAVVDDLTSLREQNTAVELIFSKSLPITYFNMDSAVVEQECDRLFYNLDESKLYFSVDGTYRSGPVGPLSLPEEFRETVYLYVMDSASYDYQRDIVHFSDGFVEILGQKIAYDGIDLEPLYDEIGQEMVEAMMYRAVRIYKAALAMDDLAIMGFASEELIRELKENIVWIESSGEIGTRENQYGGYLIAHLNEYDLAETPTKITSPIKNTDGTYTVMLYSGDSTAVEVTFILNNQVLTVSGFSLIMA